MVSWIMDAAQLPWADIIDAYHAGYSIAQICGTLGLSRVTLHWYIKHKYGMTLAEYLRQATPSPATSSPTATSSLDKIQDYAQIGRSAEQIARMIRAPLTMLDAHFHLQGYTDFAEYVQLTYDIFKANLESAQNKAALSGDNAMLVWCGKQHLGQRSAPKNLPKNSATLDIPDDGSLRISNAPCQEHGDAPCQEPGDAPCHEPGDAPCHEPGDASSQEPGDASSQEPGDASSQEPLP